MPGEGVFALELLRGSVEHLGHGHLTTLGLAWIDRREQITEEIGDCDRPQGLFLCRESGLLGDAALIRQVIADISRELPTQLRRLRDAHDAHDAEAATVAAHSIKSAAQLIGGHRTARSARAVESACRQARLTDATEDIAQLEIIADELLVALAGFSTGVSATPADTSAH